MATVRCGTRGLFSTFTLSPIAFNPFESVFDKLSQSPLGSTLKKIVLFPKLPYPSTLDEKGERRGSIPLRVSFISLVDFWEEKGGTKVTCTGVE